MSATYAITGSLHWVFVMTSRTPACAWTPAISSQSSVDSSARSSSETTPALMDVNRRITCSCRRQCVRVGGVYRAFEPLGGLLAASLAANSCKIHGGKPFRLGYPRRSRMASVLGAESNRNTPQVGPTWLGRRETSEVSLYIGMYRRISVCIPIPLKMA